MLLQEAAVLQQQGRLEEAAHCYETVLRQDPGHVEALQHLGVIHARTGRLDRAMALMRRALACDPGSPEGYNNLGMMLHAAKRSDEAVACYDKAITLRPRYAIALNNLGIALAALGRTEEAIMRYEAALAADPRYAEALNNLGTALDAAGRHEEAVARFQAALAERPDFVEARINLGHALGTLGHTAEAITQYRLALKGQPANATVHLNLADALLKEGHHEEADRHYRRACAIQPDLAPAHAGLGVALQQIGRIDDARDCFKRAIAIEPRRARHYLNLVQLSKLTADDRHLAAMRVLADGLDALGEEDRIDLHFALGKALSDIGQHDASFRHLLAGNALKRRTVSYNEAAALQRFDRIRTVFDSALLRRRQGKGNPSSAPIFIVGMPRSGSTLIEQILASHPQVFGAGEVDALHAAMRAAGLHTRAHPFPESVPDWSDEQLRGVAKDYLARLRAPISGQTRPVPVARMTDKMLDNFRYLGLIHLLFPNARIIHACRDPIDTCLSCFSLQFATVPFTYDLGELGRRYRGYARLMQHWHAILPQGRILDVRYEALVGDFETQARRIIAHCGLAWDDACLRFHETVRPVRTSSVAQVRRPIYREAVGRWRPDAAVLRPLREALGIGLQMLATPYAGAADE